MRVLLFFVFLMMGSLLALSQTSLPPEKSGPEVMREMRLNMLAVWPKEMGQKPTSDFPQVSEVVMDWPIQSTTVTVVSISTGDASIYTTGTFGVLGGIGHESVRIAATNCVKVAQQYYNEATPTKTYPYPASGRVRFYLVGYYDVRVIDADLDSVAGGKDRFSDLYKAAQQVITELRVITQHQKGERP